MLLDPSHAEQVVPSQAKVLYVFVLQFVTVNFEASAASEQVVPSKEHTVTETISSFITEVHYVGSVILAQVLAAHFSDSHKHPYP